MATNANEPAYPTIEQSENPACWNTVAGLTKREYFAAMNMEGFAASGFMIDEQCIMEAARRSVIAADALIQSLNANPDNQVKH